ncbi:hypothetical protein Tco_0688990 [Tanacetum coccineum]
MSSFNKYWYPTYTVEGELSESEFMQYRDVPVIENKQHGEFYYTVLNDPKFCAGNPVQGDSLNLPDHRLMVLQPHSIEVRFINHMLILMLSKSIVQHQDPLILNFPTIKEPQSQIRIVYLEEDSLDFIKFKEEVTCMSSWSRA